MRKIFKFLSYYNLANVIIAFLYTSLKGFFHVPVLNYFIAFLHILVSAYSYLIFFALVISFVLVVYHFIRILRYGNDSSEYIMLFVNLVNLTGTVYFSLLALAEMGV